VDQRRFVSFLLLTLAVFMLSHVLFPPPRKDAGPGDAKPGAPALPAQEADAVQDGLAEKTGEPAAVVPLADRLPAATDVPARFLTLGSLDPKTGFRMLVTLTNTGAAVHRAELSSPRDRDQHDRSGYLGELEPKNVESGIEVRTVGPGTPAAIAGLQIGDVIEGLKTKKSDKAIKTVDDFSTALAKTKPGHQVTLEVRRGGTRQTLAATLIRRPLAVLRPELENYRMRDVDPPANFVDRPSFLVTLAAIGGKPLEEDEAKQISELLEQGNWEVGRQNETSVEFTISLNELGVTLVKRYAIKPVPVENRADVNYPGYDVQLDVELRNTGEVAQDVVYRLDGPTGMPLEGWWYANKISQRWFSAAGLRDVAVRFEGSQEVQIDCSRIAQGKVEPMGQGHALAYAGVDGQYYSSVLIPQKPLEEVWFDTTEAITVGPPPDLRARAPLTYTNVTCRLVRTPLELAAGKTHRDSFQVFLGPKRPNLLSQYKAAGNPNYSLTDLIYFGWFGSVSRLMLGILHFFYGIVGNFGIAIIMLTVLVRGAMFPISYKQTQNMARMQALKPEMDRINEKYKTDMQKRSQATQELYRKQNINPLGGCLPLFIQLPIFMGLYRSLMIDVELRNASLFGEGIRWCSNLAAPDMFFDWSAMMPAWFTGGQGMFALGPYLNILPLITVGLFLVTQKMAMPEPTNEQAAMQQKMMKYMTLFMGVLFYKVASGLCIYFIASSLWGIAERKLLPKSKVAADAAVGGTQPPTSQGLGDPSQKTGHNGSPSKKPPRNAKRKR
jgi:YidC/Oxa1 family membrane protein insertase